MGFRNHRVSEVRVSGFRASLSLETWLFEAHLKDWHSLHTRVLSDFRIALMHDTVEGGRMQGITSCVFG